MGVDAPIIKKTYLKIFGKFEKKNILIYVDILYSFMEFCEKKDIFCGLYKKEIFWCSNIAIY
jgi:hypothetical protein